MSRNRHFDRVAAAVAELRARNDKTRVIGQRNVRPVLLPLVTNNKSTGGSSAHAERNWMVQLNVARIDRLLDNCDRSRNHIAIIYCGEVRRGSRFGVGRNSWITLLAPG